MQFTKPNHCILLTKLDLDAAYRRLHMLARMAVMTVTIIKQIAYILLRLPFGVANGPNDFCLISEPITNLTNEILRDNSWDPESIQSSLKPQLFPIFHDTIQPPNTQEHELYPSTYRSTWPSPTNI